MTPVKNKHDPNDQCPVHIKSRPKYHVGTRPDSFHNTTVKRCNNLMKPEKSIVASMKKGINVTKEEYLLRLNTSIDAIRYLLRQGLPFRGHDESKESLNQGNFLELVKLLGKQNVKTNKAILRNAQMLARDIQKDIVDCFADIIVKSIIEEIGGDVFCLLVDESSDVSGKEQMAVVLRYVDKLGLIKERLISVVHVKETSASCLKSNIDALFGKYGLSIKQVRGQGYDGASNMRGEFNGLRALIMRENISAHYIHCFAHQLQLVIVAVAKKNDDISDFFDMVSLLLNVAGASCKRKDMIRESQQDRVSKAIGTGQLSSRTGLNQEQALQRAGDTRWSSHYKTLKSLRSLFPDVIEVLQYVEKEGPNDAKRRQARGLMDYLKDFDFVFHLQLMLLILGHANALSLSLQRKDKDILEAMTEVKLTKQKFQQIRDDGWDDLLGTVLAFCEQHGIPKLDMEQEYIDRHKPRKKTNRTNYEHYRYDCLNPVIDLQLAEFDDRFSEVNSELLINIAAFSPKDSFAAFNVESLMELAKAYPDDFNPKELDDLCGELPIYIDNVRADARFAQLKTISELGRLMVGTNKHVAFGLVYRLLKLVLVLPIATTSVERCFLALKIVKTDLRNCIGDEFLNGCLISIMEQELLAAIPNDDVIFLFQNMGKDPRVELQEIRPRYRFAPIYSHTMARKCSHCGNRGHNSRTCGLGHRETNILCEGSGNGGGGGGSSVLRLFGVQVHAGGGGGGAGSASMKKSYSMDCLQLAVPGCSLVSPSSSSSSSLLLSIEEGFERAATNGYLSDGANGKVMAERKKGVPWSEEEHRQFLAGLEKLGKGDWRGISRSYVTTRTPTQVASHAGDWRGISRSYVTTRTPTQVASHAQKFFLRQSSMGKKKRQSSLFDMVPICENSASVSDPVSGEGASASTSLSLNAPPRHGRPERTAALDLNSAQEDDDGRAGASSASGAGTRPFPAAPATTELQPSHHHGHHCSPLELELGMSLSTPSIGT